MGEDRVEKWALVASMVAARLAARNLEAPKQSRDVREGIDDGDEQKGW
jgi:hypothetical protein